MADLSAIEDCVSEIEGLLNDVSQRLTKAKKQKNVSPMKKSEEIGYMKDRMDRAKKSLKSMRVEIRELSKVEQKPHNDKAMQLEEKINQLILDVEWFEKDEPGQAESPELDHHQIVNKAQAIQQDDIETLNRVQRRVDETKDLGANTLATMAQQRDQIIQIDKDVDQVESNLKLANRHLRTFVRRLATDKIIMGFILLIFIAVVVIIVKSIVDPKQKDIIPQINLRGNSGSSTTTTTTG